MLIGLAPSTPLALPSEPSTDAVDSLLLVWPPWSRRRRVGGGGSRQLARVCYDAAMVAVLYFLVTSATACKGIPLQDSVRCFVSFVLSANCCYGVGGLGELRFVRPTAGKTGPNSQQLPLVQDSTDPDQAPTVPKTILARCGMLRHAAARCGMLRHASSCWSRVPPVIPRLFEYPQDLTCQNNTKKAKICATIERN